MTAIFLLKGVLIGIGIAAPVGPIGVLCIRRTLAAGRRLGLATGLGAATADAVYGGIAGFGLTAVSAFLVGQQFWLALVGGAFLCCLGVRTYTSRPPEPMAQPSEPGILGAYLSTFLLTLANPMTIGSFVAVFAGFGLGRLPDYPAATALVSGVFLGSAAWWLFLTAGVGLLRSRVNSNWMRAINRISGVVIGMFGLYALAKLIVR